MKVIEPDEIILEVPGRKEPDPTHVDPWVRFLARFFDYSLFFMGLSILHVYVPFNLEHHWVPFEFVLWIPIEAALLVCFGTTPGKFFLKTKLKPNKRYRFDWMGAFRRSFSVWIRGMGMGIAIVNILCFLNAYNKLRVFKTTSWDRDDHIIVTHHPIGKWRLYVAGAVALIGVSCYESVCLNFLPF